MTDPRAEIDQLGDGGHADPMPARRRGEARPFRRRGEVSDTHQGIAAINPHLYAKVGYDPLTDFAPVARFGIGQQALVVPAASPITSVAKSGALRALAVSGARRVPAWPDVPTHAEAGVPGYEYIAWTASRRRRPPRGGWWSS